MAEPAQDAIRRLGLPVADLPDQNFENISNFYADLVGRLEALPYCFTARAATQARAKVRKVMEVIVPRVYFLSPYFPLDQLLDEFDEAEDKDAAERAVASSVDAVVAHFCPQASGSGGGGPADRSPSGSLSRCSTPSSGSSSSGDEAARSLEEDRIPALSDM